MTKEFQEIAVDPSSGKRRGWTTGSCATAATKGAMRMLLEQRKIEEVDLVVPAGVHLVLPLENQNFSAQEASCSVRKNGGDDPDCTHGASIFATVTYGPMAGISIDGGVGVGRITKPGLALPVGEAAINPIPRMMIMDAVREIGGMQVQERGFRVVISVPKGEEMAKKTLNGRLGILGGISILGTSGIVYPFSRSAFKASIAQSNDVAIAKGLDAVVLTTGSQSEKLAMQAIELPEEAFNLVGDFMGFAVRDASSKGLKRIVVGGFMGKLTKMAMGKVQTHAAGSAVDVVFLAEIAKECGASEETVTALRSANTARHAGDLVKAAKVSGFFDAICRRALGTLRERAGPAPNLELLMFGFEGEGVIGRAVSPGVPTGGTAPERPDIYADQDEEI